MLSIDKPQSDTGRCDRCSVHERAVCVVAHLSAQIELGRLSRTRIVDAGETILTEHGEESLVGNVIAGVMRITKTLPDGRQQIIGLIYPGEFFGRLYSETTEFAYEAATDVEICVMERHAFEGVVARHPELEHELLLTALNELAFARERSLLLGCQNTLERVASYLLVMLERRQQLLGRAALETHRQVAVSAISRRDLAGYLGTTIETISRHVHFLSRRGVIRIINASQFVVLDRGELLGLSGLAEDDLKLFGAARRAVARPRDRPALTIVKGDAGSEDRVLTSI